MLAVTFRPTCVPAFGYAVALLGGLAVRLAPDRWIYLAATIVTHVLAYVGIWRSFGLFPWSWDGAGWVKMSNVTRSLIIESPNAPFCGWPYDLLRPPAASSFRLDFRDAVLISMLVGWWVFALVGLLQNPGDRPTASALAWFVGSTGLILTRFVLYRNGYAPPINLWTRIRTGRFLIPNYDRIYVAPLCAAAVGAFTPTALMALGIPSEAAFPTALSLVMLIVLTAKPSLTSWQLTGGHRLAFPAIRRQDGAKYVRVG